MQEIELDKGECSHSPLHDDVSDDASYDFYDSDIDNYYYYDIKLYHDSFIHPM